MQKEKYSFYDKEKGETTYVFPERWCWSVEYAPNAEQIAESERLTHARDAKLTAEKDRRIVEMHARGADQKDVDTLEAEYEMKMMRPVPPETDKLHQFDQDGVFHRIGEVDQDRVILASLYKFDDTKRRIDIPWRPGMKLVHLYKMTKPAGGTAFIKTYRWGYKYNGAHAFAFVMHDDRILLSPEDDVDFTRFNLPRFEI